ncbi:MAG TPA: T9SS type A sorting domain-containing protein [Candidatus Kapabacteria bacterium]|jgi:hypothetical protein
MKQFIAILAAICVCMVATQASAQVMLRSAVVASSGSIVTNGTQAAAITVGQPVVGVASNGQMVGQFGFWTSPAVAPLQGVSAGPALGLSIKTWPNPASDAATVRVTLASATTLELSLYDITGKQVELISNANHPSGTFDQSLDLTSVPSGRYIVVARMPGAMLEEPISIVR